jgi:hypothetical protein
MKLSIVPRPMGSIRCPDCKGFGFLATTTPLRRLPCERCKGWGISYGLWICPQSRRPAVSEWTLVLA